MAILPLSSEEVPPRDTCGQTRRTKDKPPSPKSPLTRHVPPILWVGFTGIRGGQRVTNGEFDDFSYHRHSATVDRSHPLSSWEQRAPWGKIQQSTSNGGDERRDADMTATAMDGATTMHWQRNGDNDRTATTGGGSLAAARQRQWWLCNRTTAVTVEAWQWQVGGGVVVTVVAVAAPAAWWCRRRQLDNDNVFPDDNASGVGPFVRHCRYTCHPPAYPAGLRLCCATRTCSC
jgi:hypothetical protein